MKRAGDLLQSFLDEKIMKKAKGYSQLFSSWVSIAGEQCAAHSRISDLTGTLLIIEADHPGWVQILQTQQAELLKAVQRRFSDLTITGISFRLSREPYQQEDENQPVPERNRGTVPEEEPDNPQEQHDTASLYDKIDDENFKESLKRLEESIKSRKSRNRG